MDINLISFETSGPRCSVALLRASAGAIRSIATRSHDGGRDHGQQILPLASSLLREEGLTAANLHGVAFGQGPGGFTGLRVACGVAQGVAYTLNVPVLPVVSNLAVAAASGAAPGQLVITALDARMEEVYLAVYRAPGQAGAAWQELLAPQLVAGRDALPWVESLLPGWQLDDADPVPPLWAGDGWLLAGEDARFQPTLLALRPDADVVARLGLEALWRGEGKPAQEAMPLYVRDKVAFTTAERAKGDGGNPRATVPIYAQAMTAGHLESVVDLEAQVQKHPWTRRNFEDALAAGYDAWVLCEGEAVVGFYIAMLAPDVSHLLAVAVAPERQRQGWGWRLLEHFAQRAAEAGLEGLLLEVRPSNAGALALYRRFGFEQIGVRKEYYEAGAQREDAWVFQKRLPAAAPGSVA
ncbi:tRNA (adenosine(37)-N6)-threonylcarbamoyltransferase complex dimerization subunit type 1 TsaB [Kerstersia sp.]|uniref:tRNA (adenosine(37)-N6)-threonylcarbamoyltransferase complex dimerization subunit type 1 TsaB n=1 Tax=Kerstersia sp. TaxID=1930783 RepID=UPI003F90FAB4